MVVFFAVFTYTTGLLISSETWVGLTWISGVLNSAWADRNLAEAAGHLDDIVELPNSSHPGLKADESTCTCVL